MTAMMGGERGWWSVVGDILAAAAAAAAVVAVGGSDYGCDNMPVVESIVVHGAVSVELFVLVGAVASACWRGSKMSAKLEVNRN